jgi:hypothetical protein
MPPRKSLGFESSPSTPWNSPATSTPKISRDPGERAARETREPRHMSQFLQRGTTPQGAGADEEESEG